MVRATLIVIALTNGSAAAAPNLAISTPPARRRPKPC